MKKTKVSIKVLKHVWDEFSRAVASTGCIRRDALLNLWIANDIDRIRGLPENPLSDDEYLMLVRGDWAGEKKIVGLFLSLELVNELSSILREKNVPRNVFFNCYLQKVAIPMLLNLNTQIFDAPFIHFDDSGNHDRPYDYLFPIEKSAQTIKKRYQELQEEIAKSHEWLKTL